MIGRLDQKIRIERKSLVPDGMGGSVKSWIPLPLDPEPFARVELRAGSEVQVAGARQARQAATFTIRARSDLSNADRIIWSGVVWDITGKGAPVARARYQRVEAVSGQVSP